MLSTIFDKHDLSVAQVASATGINRATIYNWNRNPKSMNFYGASLIAKVLQDKSADISLSTDYLAQVLFSASTETQLELLPEQAPQLATDDFVL